MVYTVYQQEVWKYSRNDISDVIGVGWKVKDNNEANTITLASIRPEQNASHPHTRILVKRKDENITLEHCQFIQRIANGNPPTLTVALFLLHRLP